MNDANLSERIKANRKSKGLTQARFAENLGVSEMTVRRWESGKRSPRMEEMRKIAAALSIPLSELTDDNAPSQVSQLEQLIQKLNEIQPSLQPKDINKEEKIKDPLVGLTYWGGVVDNARLVASEGTEQEKNTVLMMLNMAFNAFQKEGRTLNSMEKAAQKIGVQQNNFNGDNNYNGDIPKVATA